MTFQDLTLGHRAVAVLRAVGLYEVELSDAAARLNELALYRIKGSGRKTVREIRQALAAHGFAFSGPDPAPRPSTRDAARKEWAAIPPKLRAKVRAILREQAAWREKHAADVEGGGEEYRASMASEAEALHAGAKFLDLLDAPMRRS